MCDNLEINQIPEYRFDGIVYHDVYSCRILQGQDENKKANIKNSYTNITGVNCLPLGHECPFYANDTMGECDCFQNRNN